MADPYIVTAELPPDVFAWANALRRAHFPPERNKLDAHVTLFHSFAPSLYEELRRVLSGFASRFAPPQARVSGLMDLGGGTAIALASPGLIAVHGAISEHFRGALTAQDSHVLRPHITIQNKVERSAAKALQAELSPVLDARRFAFTGLGLHIYRGGAWEAAGRWPFRGKEALERA